MAVPDLRPLAPATVLAALPGPVRAAALGDRLHLVGGWSARAAVHLAVDAAGAAAGAPRTLALAGVSSIAAFEDRLVVAGAGLDDRAPVVVELEPDGRERRRVELPLPDGLTAWPQVAAAAGTAWAAWATGAGVWLTALDGPPAPVRLLEPRAPLAELVLASAGDRVLAGCVHGAPPLAEVVDRAGARVPVDVEQPFSLALAGMTAACVSRIGGEFHVLGPGDVHRRLPPPRGARSRSVRLVGDGGGRMAVLLQVAIRPGAPGRPESVRIRQFAGGGRALAGDPDGLVELDPPGAAYEAGGWLGSRLLVVHGAGRPMITVLEATQSATD